MLDSILLCLPSFHSLPLLMLDYVKVLVLPFPSSPSPSFIPYLAGYPLCLSIQLQAQKHLMPQISIECWSQPKIKAFRFGFMSTILFIAAHFFQSGSIINRNWMRNNLVISFIKKLSFLLDFFSQTIICFGTFKKGK